MRTPSVYCSDCGSRLSAGARFCTDCGTGAGVRTALQGLAPFSGPAPAVTASAPVDGATLTLRDLPISTLLPVRDWLRDQTWRRGRHGLFAAFAVAPSVLLQLTADDHGIQRAAWGFALYFGFLWLLAMYALIRPERPDRWLLTRVVAFTAVAGVAIAVALERWLGADEDDLLSMIFKVGLPEELAKAIPIYLFIFLGRRVWTTRTFVFIGVVSGLTFGVTEAVMYTVLYDDMGSALGESTTVISMWRLLTGGLFHGCLAGITAYFIGLAYWYRRAVWSLMSVGLTISAVLHGTYNASAGTWLGSVLVCVTVLVFLGYVRSGDRIALELGRSKLAP